ncbi:hypothetical protein F5Y18DRAFT_439819 [Xylariaceae sp. FL1019]|nr:hypothetical protein F5Y18DRAFT_439819 [Xylariaceae sp. FL1019]
MAPDWTALKRQQMVYIILHYGKLSEHSNTFPFGKVTNWTAVHQQLGNLGFTSTTDAEKAEWSRIRIQRLAPVIPPTGFPATMTTSTQRLSMLSGIAIDNGNNAVNVVAAGAVNWGSGTAAASSNVANVANVAGAGPLTAGGNAASHGIAGLTQPHAGDNESVHIPSDDEYDLDDYENGGDGLDEDGNDEHKQSEHGGDENGPDNDAVDDGEDHNAANLGGSHTDAARGVDNTDRHVGERLILTAQDQADVTNMAWDVDDLPDQEFRDQKKDAYKRSLAFMKAQELRDLRRS